MTATHVAFVRAVMIGREGLHRTVLVDMFERAGALRPTSHLSTGNVSFGVDAVGLDAIVDSVETELAGLLGRVTPLFVRSRDELRTLLDADLFADAPFAEVAGRIVTFFRDLVPASLELPLTAPNGDWAVFASTGREVCSVMRAWPDRQAQDPGGAIQRVAGEPVTTRSIGTLEHLARKLA